MPRRCTRMQHLPRACGSHCGGKGRAPLRLAVTSQGGTTGAEYKRDAVNTGYCPHLAPRELTILELVNAGLSDAQIAKRLRLTKGSASASVGRIRIKFGGGTRYDSVQRARALGLVRKPKDGGLQPPRRARPRNVRLTPSERNVLELMNRGFDNAQIAKQLRITVASARTYAYRIGSKLGGGSRFEVVQTARRLGLVKALAHAGPAAPEPVASKAPHLTRRELDVLDLMNRGLTNGPDRRGARRHALQRQLVRHECAYPHQRKDALRSRAARASTAAGEDAGERRSTRNRTHPVSEASPRTSRAASDEHTDRQATAPHPRRRHRCAQILAQEARRQDNRW